MAIEQLPKDDRVRAFFALWPAPETQHLMLRHARDIHRLTGGTLTRPESIHLTLAFLGEIDAARIDAARDAAARAEFKPFALSIETAGCWNHNRIAWLAPRDRPAELDALVTTLGSGLRDRGFSFEERPHSPHITIVRKARCGRMDFAFEPIKWRVREFVLVRSQLHPEGSRYSVVGRWPQQPAFDERTQP